MTPDQLLKSKFPNASKSVLALNRHENKTRPKVSNPKPKRNKKAALDKTVSGETKSIPRVIVRITGFRVRPLDPDNFAGGTKDVIDGLRHAGLLQGDEAWRIKLETEQEKVSTFKDERTEIEIEYPK